jgi:hypothetical protein
MQFKGFIIMFILLIGMAMPVEIHSAPRQEALCACAAFAPDGMAAAATINGAEVSVECTDAAGRISHIRFPLQYPASPQQLGYSVHGQLYFCEIHFSEAGDLAAIGVMSNLHFNVPTAQLQVAVVDIKSMKLIANWTIERDAQILSPVMAGFVEGTQSLVVAGVAPADKDKRIWKGGLLAAALYSLDGKPIILIHTLRHLEDGVGSPYYPKFIDAVHNRLWTAPCHIVSATMSHQTLCPIEAMNLMENQSPPLTFTPSLEGKKRADLWFFPRSFVAQDADTIVFGEGAKVWRVNIRKQTVDRFDIPNRRHYPHFDQIGGPAAISPDGQVIAMPRQKSRLAFPFIVDNYVYQGTDLMVIRQDPFKLLGIFPVGRTFSLEYRSGNTPAFAIDHRQGKTIVLLYRKDRWVRHEIRD